MATRSRKDWLSPHKVSLLILIKYISSSDDEQEDYLDCLRRSRHKLSLLLLEFFEVPLFSSKLKLYWNWFRFIQQIVCGTFRRGSRINADRFPKRAPQAQASRGFRGNALLGIFFIYIYLTPEKSPFMDFWVVQTGYWQVPFSSGETLQLGKIFLY